MALDGAILAALLQACAPNVAPETMVAVIRVESEGDPFRIGVNSGGAIRRQPSNAADAIATARGLLRRGGNFDAGLMQINSANFARLGLTPETVFDPCTNLRAGARVLTDNYGRARDAGHANPLQAAISEYNTGSRSRGLSNGYVGRVYAAAATGNAPFPAAARPANVRLSSGALSARGVGQILLDAFGGRITDTVRPMNASYGAANSYHKYGQAVDFVPRGGVGAITRQQIRAVMAANGIRIVELLGPGDRDHDDHWHVAFATDGGAPVLPASAPWTVAVSDARDTADRDGQSAPILLAAATSIQVDGVTMEGDEGPPPAWDVFAVADWQRRQSGAQTGAP
jgi:hypothetical protein